MAIVKCTECGKEISDKAAACPHCGCPMSDILKATEEQKAEAEKRLEQKKLEAEIKAAEKAKKKEKPALTPEQKKKKTILITTSAVAVILIAVLGWYFGIRSPQVKAYSEYLTSAEAYNQSVTRFNDEAALFNEKANAIIVQNSNLTEAIKTAQAVIDIGSQPYEPDKMTTLSNTIKNAKNNKGADPSVVEFRDLLPDDDSLSRSFAKEILSAKDALDADITLLDNESVKLNAETKSLTIPDYNSLISDIKAQQQELEDSYAIMEQVTNPSQEFVIDKLNKVENIANIAYATEENDPNGHLGKDGGYTAQIYFSSPLLGTETLAGDALIDGGTDAGGSVEIYKTVEDVEKRDTYLGSFDGSIFDSGKHIIVGTMLVRVSTNLTASKQTEFINEIIASLTSLN